MREIDEYLGLYEYYKKSMAQIARDIVELENILSNDDTTNSTPSGVFKIQCYHELNEKNNELTRINARLRKLDNLMIDCMNEGDD